MEMKPTIKERNIFWAGFSASRLTSLICAFFTGLYFYLTINFFKIMEFG
jgi:hypothetical protein